jgi:hypothetical protein
MTNPLDFAGKVALVTGAAAGMGLATAQAFAEAGAMVVLADISEGAVSAEAKKLAGAGHKALAIGCDVSDDAEVAAMVERTVAEFGRLNAAFNNAGVMARITPVADSSRDEWDRVSRAQRWGGPIEEIRPGDVVWFPPGEKHWPGAAPTTAMTHIAVQEKLDGNPLGWLEHVSPEQYEGHSSED